MALVPDHLNRKHLESGRWHVHLAKTTVEEYAHCHSISGGYATHCHGAGGDSVIVTEDGPAIGVNREV
jgi:hypothetical protein